MTTTQPGRVPGVRRTGHQEGTGVAVSAAQVSDGGQEGSGDSDAPQRHTACDAAVEHLERSRAIAVRQLGEALDRAERMTRQRDEAVKAFRRERARVARVEAAVDTIGVLHPIAADHVLRALADRPTDA